MRTFNLSVRIILPLLILLPAVPAAPAQAATEAAFNVTCTVASTHPDDPIVYPGQPGKSHMHDFFGNTSTNANTTTQSLLASPSNCNRGFENVDHSAYWVPALYKAQAQGNPTLVEGSAKEHSMTIYYRHQQGTATVHPFPQGLKMIAGDSSATTPQPKSVVTWRCRSLTDSSSFSPTQADIPTCASSQHLMGAIHFPSCWNGVSSDSADHRSHMAYPAKGVCPATHPVKVPEVTMEVNYRNVNGDGKQYTVASGGQYSLHADFFAAWDTPTQTALVNSCLNTPRKCTFTKLADLHLNVAPPTKAPQATAAAKPTSSGAVLAAKATPIPAPTPAPAMAAASSTAPLPETGAGLFLGSLAAAALFVTGLYYYRSRRDLLAAMRSRR